MRYSSGDARETDGGLFNSLEAVVKGMGLELIELNVSPHRGSVQIRVTVYRKGNLGVEECSKAHRALLPRLELAFPGQDLSVEVSSPGIDRQIKSGAEFVHYTGRGIRCYRTDISDWSAGILESADNEGIKLKMKDGTTALKYETIARAKLDHSQEV
ncbi:MAG: ribosome assembly cofactor RimP [Treponema sp.]|nr:ribosome assembly cofactor RimP [Treponema sp.]